MGILFEVYTLTVLQMKITKRKDSMQMKKRIRLRVYHPEDKTAKFELKESILARR